MLRAPSLLLPLVAVLAFPTERADACSEIVLDARVADETIAPADGDDDVPLNALVWVGGLHVFPVDEATGAISEQPLPVQILDAEGGVVAASTTQVASRAGVLSVVRPLSPLLANSAYRIMVDRGELEPGNAEEIAAFTTGDDVDDEPPAVPAAASITPQQYVYGAYTCGQPGGATVALAPSFLTFVDIVDAEPFDDDGLDGRVTTYARGESVFVNAPFQNGTFELRLSAVDVAGNFSGWSEPAAVALPQSGCTCATSSAGDVTLAAGALALVALLSRRRSR